MKFLNLRRKLRNSALAVLFAVAVMFVMPATAFADDTDIIDNGIADNVEFENDIENDNNIDNIDSTIGDYTENTEPLIPSDNCYGICCDECDENCDGTCCDMCTIINVDDINIPDNSEFGNEFIGTDVDNETDNSSEEEGNLDNSNYGVTAPTDGFTNSNENIAPVIPIPDEPIFPDDYYNDDNVTVPEDPENIYQHEADNEFTDADPNEDSDEDTDDETEIIYDDLTDEEEIIYGDDDITDDENSETSDDSDSKDSDNESSEENSDNSDEENADNTIDEENENNGNSDSENSDNAEDKEDSDNSDNENLDNITDVENSDNSDIENSDNIIDEDDPDNSDNAADDEDNGNSDEENPDDSDSEALEEEDNPIINVVLPASISVVINPYNLKVVDESGFHYSILSPEYSIKNYSNCDVSIIATASASTDGGIVLSPHDLIGNETEFTAFAYIEATSESGVYSNNYSNSANQLVFSNEAVTKEILTLADGSNGETTGYFKIIGNAVLPDGAQYSAQAAINMVITFDIDPISNSVVSNDAVEEETENTENAENIESAENTESAENVEDTENVENIEIENVENTESIENVQGLLVA